MFQSGKHLLAENATTKHRNKLSARAIITLGKALEAVCHTNASGLAVYDKGHDDETVAKEATAATGATITTGNAQGLRRQLLGRLYIYNAAKTAESMSYADATKELAGMSATLAEIKSRIAALEAWAERRPVEPFGGVDKANAALRAMNESLMAAVRKAGGTKTD